MDANDLVKESNMALNELARQSNIDVNDLARQSKELVANIIEKSSRMVLEQCAIDAHHLVDEVCLYFFFIQNRTF